MTGDLIHIQAYSSKDSEDWRVAEPYMEQRLKAGERIGCIMRVPNSSLSFVRIEQDAVTFENGSPVKVLH